MKGFRRWRYVVDWRAQFGTALQIVGVLAAICLICAVGVNFVKSNEALEAMAPEAIRNFLFRATSVQFVINAITLTILAVYLTHRFAGPAFVLERAVRESLKGDHSRPVKLRERDYLKPLAGAVEELRHRAEDQERLIAEVTARLEASDADGARELLKGSVAEKPAAEPVDEAAATVQ